MIRNINNTDQFFASALQADESVLQPDDAIQERLRYMISLKQIESKESKRNLFRFDLSKLFLRTLSYKTGILGVAIVMVFFLVQIGMNPESTSNIQVVADTSFIDTISLELSEKETIEIN